MFDIGFSELLLTGLVALIVLGPERLPKAARLAGMWIRRARTQWQAVKSELENELADEDMKRSILRAREDLREAQESLRRQLADVEARMARTADTDPPPAAQGVAATVPANADDTAPPASHRPAEDPVASPSRSDAAFSDEPSPRDPR